MTETLANYSTRATLQDTKFLERVLALLSEHRRQPALTGMEIARTFGFTSDRIVRVAIRELIAQGHPIAASVSEPMGYRLITDAHEAEIYERVLRSRALKTLERLRDFRRATAQEFGAARQLPLFSLEPLLKELR